MLKYLLIFSLCLLASCASPDNDKWGSIKTATANTPQIYGTYTAGCLDGAVALPAAGEGYELENGARHRFFGHPDLVNFLQKFAAENHTQNNGELYISDMAQPRGGPIVGGHGSHQVGLDVDIWYGKNGDLPIDLVNPDRKSLNMSEWKKFDVRMLEKAAAFPVVERIFVDPYIKKQLCSEHKGEGWMSKIRPWRSHSDHFHVRLSCPAGDKLCKAQAPVSGGDGCDSSLDWWFSVEAKTEAAKPKEKREVVLPVQCSVVSSQ